MSRSLTIWSFVAANRSIATWTVMLRPSSFASSQSWRTTSGWQKPGPRVASPIVTSPSSELKYCLRTRRASSPSQVRTLPVQSGPNHQSWSEVFPKP